MQSFRLLLENGANVVALNNDCCIPLDICKSEDIKELFKQDINIKGIDLNKARHGEEIKMMEDAKRWASTGDYQEEPHPTTGATGLHVAACKGYIKVLDLLIKATANINSRDMDGWTPLHAAAHWGQKEACEVLLENMCDMNVKNNCDQTALDVADDSVVPILEDFKKKHDINKNIESIGKQANLLPLPPKKKPPKADFDNTLSIVANQSGHPRLPEPSNSGTEDEEDESNEAADTVGELPSSDASHSTAELPTFIDIHSNENDDSSDVIVSSNFEAPSRREELLKLKDAESEIDHIIVPGRASPSSIPLLSGTSQNIESSALKSDLKVATDDCIPAWRRGGSLRTRIHASQIDESATDKAGVRRTRSEASTGADASLRRAYSFESDSKFYTRLTSARNRIKAIEAASAALTANLLEPANLISNLDASLMSSSLTNQNNPPLPAYNSLDVILRRKETDVPRSPRPTTVSCSTNQHRSAGLVSSIPSVQMRSGDSGGIFPFTPTTPGGTKIGPVSKFKQFLFKSFVPPARDEESETQRKAHAKRVRETRRSTQGVTLEELKSAEQYVKNSQHANATTAPSEPTSQFSIITAPANISMVLRKDEEQSLERRPSWRLRVDDSDRNKFSLEDTRNPISRPFTDISGNQSIGHSSDNIMTVQRSPVTRKSNKTEVCPVGRPPRPPHEEKESQLQDEKDKEMKNTGAQGAILRKKKQKRRSTGVVQYNAEGTDADRQVNVLSDTEVGSGKGSELSNDYDQKDADSSRENGVSSRINYRKLYEEILKENQLLKSRLTRYEEEVGDLKTKLDKVSHATPRIGAEESEKREKRALELKMEAMELELREVRHLKSENQKIRDENGALIRVISKLSK